MSDIANPAMLSIILGAIAPVLLTALIGFAWIRSGRVFDGATLTPLVTEIGTPCLVFSTLAGHVMSPAAFAHTAIAAIAIIAGFFVVNSAVLKLCGLRLRVYLPSMSFPNSGNLGLPLALYAFGPEGLGFAIVFLTFTSITNFTVGQAIAAGTADWRAIVKMPIVYAVILGVGSSALGFTLPLWLANTMSVLGSITVPMMLLLLGASLARLKIAAVPRALGLGTLRIGGGACVGYAITTLFGIEGVAKFVLIQQSAMPVAVFNYLFALKYDNEPEEIAGIVVISTLMAIVTAPSLLYLMLK